MANFIKTNEKITFTFNGWYGYHENGETITSNVYIHPMVPGAKFIKFYSRKTNEWTIHTVNENIRHEITGAPIAHYQCTIY